MNDRRVRTVFLGSGRFGVESLWRLDPTQNEHVELVGVVTAPPKPSGRGRRLTATAIDSAAACLDLPTLRPLRLGQAVDDVLALGPELVVLADYGQIVPRPILELPYGALNLHPSLLPRHRGASPIQAAILDGDRETGVTLMKMDEGLDTGPIVAQQRVALDGTETTPVLGERLQAVAEELLNRSLGPWIRGELEARPQPDEGATMTRPLRKEDGRLDPSRPAALLERQVRAYQPWPGSFFDTDDGRIVVWRAALGDPSTSDEPGTLTRTADFPALATARGTLALLEVQPAGGKRMRGADLLRGRRSMLGSRVLGAPSASREKER